ncbi:diacylglycerol O-acyltransferase 1 [Pseudogymnoascus destructans]|nr:diacylglycerol O-acyltransferase 1 [Pseudogymnoascus destructans]OAF55162.1 diacylglycerol O-acyltransferase 1 [Pseudogymnoascus destructans]
MTTMAMENGIPTVAELETVRQEVREELDLPPKSFADAVVEGEEELNGVKEGETVLPNSFAEVVVEGAKEGADEGERVGGEGNRETNGDKKEQRNGDKKARREQANNHTNDDGGKSYAAALLQPPKPITRQRRSKPSTRAPPLSHHTSIHSAELYSDTEFEDSDIFTNYPPTPSPSHSTEHLVSIKTPSRASSPGPQDGDPNRTGSRTLTSGREAGKNWHASRIRFAPLNIPLQRRLQTAMVLAHTLCIAVLIGTFLFACAIPLLWPLIVPYMVYIMFSKAGYSGELSMRSPRLRGSKLWSLFAGYFPARLHRTVELSPTRKYIFGYHPHGIISHGAFAAFATEALGFAQLFPGITNSLLTLDSNFRIPFYREYILALGLASVSRQSCENLLSRGGLNGEGMGRAITIVVGGARESLDARPGTLRLVLRRRYGFVKMALRTGADLVPVLGFGENELYDQFSVEGRPWIRRGQDLLKRTLGWTLPLFHARGVFNYDVGLVSYRRAVNVVVGRPIPVRQNRMPSVEEVEELHERYCEELVRLWETWKDDFAQGRAEEMRIGD